MTYTTESDIKAMAEAIRYELKKSSVRGDKYANASKAALAASTVHAELARVKAECERLKGLMWYAWREFNAIRARDGAPDGVCQDYWNTCVECFADAIGDTNPWPSDSAKQALQQKGGE